ncbi:PAS domain-containing hybrid sensor histidine kinase/response regulator [Paraglaciecola sp.]|uniref:PAS domain-containing hybrid sensor histidine kinase/response regulator n=1 Tax=Paraglaciecola sp. TaxID=1920173 RepID=UPI003EF89685
MAIGWVALALVYLGGLFWLGRWGDSDSPLAKKLTSHPAIYSLALAIYCTAWTFFGAVGEASRNNWQYLPILLGPILVYLLGFRFIQKLTLVSKKQHITTIADFISSRYGKRQTVALLVTIIALLATIPYVALQLKAIGSAFQLVSEQQDSESIVLLATIFIALFSIYFGTQRTDVTEYRRGFILAIAFESSIKLFALLVIAIVAFFMWYPNSSAPLFASFSTAESLSTFESFPFIAQTIMAGAAVICLPRQFHVAVVDNQNLDHLKTARWMFPLYLGLIAITIPIITVAGQTLLANTAAEPDTYVLELALISGSGLVQMLVFVGGLSAATAMIIVATLTLSTMLTNDVILPKVLAKHNSSYHQQNVSKNILITRRWVIAGLLLLAYLYHQQMANSSSLASIGLIAFSLVIQLLPSIIGGLYWKKGHAHGVYAGLISGIVVWILWLMLPAFEGNIDSQLTNNNISFVAMISLVANFVAYTFFSYIATERLVDRIQAQAFVAPRESLHNQPKKPSPSVTTADLITLLSTFLGDTRCQGLIDDFQQKHDMTVHSDTSPHTDFVAFCERALGGVLGGSSARALIDSVLNGKKLGFEEVVNFFDDSTQAIKFNTGALFTSIESLDQGISVIDKNLNLVAWNKRYLELFNYPKDMVAVGMPIENMVRYNASRGDCGLGEIDALVKKRLAHLSRGHAHKFVRQRSDGKMIEMVGNPLPGGGFVTSFSDITSHIEIQEALKDANIDLENRVKIRGEQVQAINAELHDEIARRVELEQELINARQNAERANADKTRFLALASHDILQPLNAAKLYLSALDEVSMQDDVRNMINKLGESVSSSEALIATLLDIARLDQGDLKPVKGPHSVIKILSPLIHEFSMQAQSKGLKFSSRIADVWVDTDKTYLYRIVQNLLSNAVKYTDTGGILLSVRARQNSVVIQVWDTGVGISETEQQHIFGDFYRVDGSKQRGAGLGLGVVSRLSEKLGSPLTMKSELRRGSCFTLTLAMVPALSPEPEVLAKTYTGLAGLEVLCVDDKIENLDAMQTLLNKWKLICFQASSADEAQQKFDQNQPDVLLVDYHLGNGINGLELISQLRTQAGKEIPAALVTASQDEEIKKQCAATTIGYLSKPIKPAKLRALLLSLKNKR